LPALILAMVMAYPAGAAGIAFLLLRAQASLIAVALALEDRGLPTLLRIVLVVLACAMTVGVMTRTAAVIAGAALLGTAAWSASGVIAAAEQILAMLALAVAGPGAYSIDARLFGRRVIISGAATRESVD
jgi:uncharacterized membrane protein YphA (DoxX/SURF4 family)